MRLAVMLPACVTASLAIACGCASQNDQRLAALVDEQLRQIRSGTGAVNTRPDQPDAPLAPAPGLLASKPQSAPAGRETPEALSSPLPASEAPAKVTIQPESIVQVNVKEDPTLDGHYEVNDSSAISFKYIGLVFLPNMTADDAAGTIEKILLSRGFRSATVALRIAKASYDRVRVTGAVVRPDDLKIGPGSSVSLAEVLRRCGGLRAAAAGAKIKLVRKGMLDPLGMAASGEEYSLVGSDGAAHIPDVALRNGDWVQVFPQGETAVTGLGDKEILLLGEVITPGVVRFSNSEPCSLLRLVLKMGGLPKWADPGKVKIVRKDENGLETEIKADVRELLKRGNLDQDVPLQNGDRVIIRERRLLF